MTSKSNDTLGALATVVRSKNAGALLLTIDVMFDDAETFRRVVQSGALSRSQIARLYDVSDNEVDIIVFDLVRAIKITLPRLHRSGDPEDGDVYGAQQHVPILDLPIPQ